MPPYSFVLLGLASLPSDRPFSSLGPATPLPHVNLGDHHTKGILLSVQCAECCWQASLCLMPIRE